MIQSLLIFKSFKKNKIEILLPILKFLRHFLFNKIEIKMKNLKKNTKIKLHEKTFALIILMSKPISWTSQAQQEGFQSPKLIGEGTLKVLMWEVYDLRLFTDGTPLLMEK